MDFCFAGPLKYSYIDVIQGRIQFTPLPKNTFFLHDNRTVPLEKIYTPEKWIPKVTINLALPRPTFQPSKSPNTNLFLLVGVSNCV